MIIDMSQRYRYCNYQATPSQPPPLTGEEPSVLAPSTGRAREGLVVTSYLLRAVYQEQVTCPYHCDPDDEPDPPIENRGHFQWNRQSITPQTALGESVTRP